MATDDVPAGEVTLFLDDNDGRLVHGDLHTVDAALAELLAPGEVEVHRRATSRVADVAAVGASAAAVATTAQEYLRLTADSLEKVKRLGAQTDGTGAQRGYVRGDGGQMAGQLTFETVTLGAEQVLALRTAAVSMALRSAIADVQAAVERVEERVSQTSSGGSGLTRSEKWSGPTGSLTAWWLPPPRGGISSMLIGIP